MDTVRGALRDLRRALVFTRFFHSFMNTLLIFLVSTSVLLLLGISWFFALIPSLAYLLFATFKNVTHTRYKDIEERVPELRWQLRTVSDNMNSDNEVVRSLKQNVLAKAKEIRTSAFVDNKVTVYKLFGIFGLAFLIVVGSAFSVSFPDFKGIIPTGAVAKLGDRGGIGDVAFEGDYAQESNRDIYGKDGVVALGEEELQLEIDPEQNKADLTNPQDTEDLAFDQRSTITDIGAAPDKSYDDKFKKKESELIKEYLKKLTEFSNRQRR